MSTKRNKRMGRVAAAVMAAALAVMTAACSPNMREPHAAQSDSGTEAPSFNTN